MNLPNSPELVLALAKITALILVILGLAPLLKDPVHRARLWTLTFIVLPFLFLSSFIKPLFRLIPTEASPSPPETSSPGLAAPVSTSPTIPLPDVSEPRATLPVSPVIPVDQPLADSPTRIIPPEDPEQTTTAEVTSPVRIPWIPLILCTGTILSLLPFLISFLRIQFLKRSEAQDPPRTLWREIHQSNKTTPFLFFTPSPAAPFTCGIFRPQVLLPDDSPLWPFRRIRSTLLHEAAHLHRRDPLVRLLATVIRAFFWFHPLVWLAHRKLVAAQEQACDQYALTYGVSPDDYAEDLLASATHSHLTPTDALSMAKWSQLGNRIRHILDTPKPTSMTTITLTTIVALIATTTLTTIGFSQNGPTDQSGTLSRSDATSPVKEEQKKRSRGALLDRNNKPLATTGADGLRTYPAGKSAAHLTGIVGRTNSKKPEYYEGKTGLEKAYEKQLSAHKDVKLTLDATLQEACFNLLATQEHPGSIIVQDPNSGEILAMASYPSFDPNLFIPFITQENFTRLQDDKRSPMFLRATASFAPGSVVKPLVALAGEYAGLKNPEIHCKGFMSFGKDGRIKIRDWKSNRDEKLRIPGALKTSCNTYFMELALRTGLDALTETGALFHLNKTLISGLPDSSSIWTNWPKDVAPTRVNLALNSIGHGYVLLSPLEINAVTSALATGTWHQPHLLPGQPLSLPSVPLVGKGQITEQSLDHIRQGMILTVNEKGGTGTRASLPKVKVAGKTGTAQIGGPKRSYNSWFTGYAPAEKPAYSITVLLEGAPSGGKHAAPMASAILKLLLAKN